MPINGLRLGVRPLKIQSRVVLSCILTQSQQMSVSVLARTSKQKSAIYSRIFYFLTKTLQLDVEECALAIISTLKFPCLQGQVQNLALINILKRPVRAENRFLDYSEIEKEILYSPQGSDGADGHPKLLLCLQDSLCMAMKAHNTMRHGCNMTTSRQDCPAKNQHDSQAGTYPTQVIAECNALQKPDKNTGKS